MPQEQKETLHNDEAVFKIREAAAQRCLQFFGPADLGVIPRELLRLTSNGTSQYASEEDLLEAAKIFWKIRCASPKDYFTITISPFDAKEKSGFKIHVDDTLEYFGGFAPDASTQHALEVLVTYRP